MTAPWSPAPDGPLRRRLERWVAKKLGDDFLAKLNDVPTPRNEFGVDPFGFDPDFLAWALPAAHFLYESYFRVEVHGTHNVPDGPCLLVSNHSGQIPLDGMMISSSMLFDPPRPRILRSMVERWVPSLPFVSVFMSRCGQVLGSPDNCRVLLDNGEAILVFPEGVRGINKTFDKRYQLQDFGYGFMRLALEKGVPIVPVAVVGAEEQAPALFDAKPLARLLGLPAFPITPTFPLLPVVGMLPYPVKYRIWFGEPMHFSGDPDDEDLVVGEQVDQVKDAVAGLIAHGLDEREAIFW